MGYFYESRCHDFGEPEGRVKIQETNKNIPRYYTLNRLITYRAKLLNADWLRQRAFFLNFPSMEGKITRS